MGIPIFLSIILMAYKNGCAIDDAINM
jgi:hypothetical protein